MRGIKAADVTLLRDLKKENSKLKRIVADEVPVIIVVQEVESGKSFGPARRRAQFDHLICSRFPSDVPTWKQDLPDGLSGSQRECQRLSKRTCEVGFGSWP